MIDVFVAAGHKLSFWLTTYRMYTLLLTTVRTVYIVGCAPISYKYPYKNIIQKILLDICLLITWEIRIILE